MKKNNNMKSWYLFTLLLAMSLFNMNSAYALNCDNDEQAPTLDCLGAINVSTIAGNQVVIWPQDVNTLINDDCTATEDLILSIERLEDYTGTPPTTTSVTLPDQVGEYTVASWVQDEAGNATACLSIIYIVGVADPDCASNDDEAPSISCLETLNTSMNPSSSTAIINGSSLIDAATDNCDFLLDYSVNLASEAATSPTNEPTITFTELGDYEVQVWAIDDFGNYSSCSSVVSVVADPACIDDVIAPIAVCDADVEVYPLETDANVLITADMLDGGSYDNCSDVSFSLSLNGVATNADEITVPNEAAHHVLVLNVIDEAGNESQCWVDVYVLAPEKQLDGSIYKDDNDNCTLDATEQASGYDGWTVKLTNTDSGETLETLTDASGYYSFTYRAYSDENYTVELITPDGLNTGCATTASFMPNSPTHTQNFAFKNVEDCLHLTVDVSAPFLRRCFENFYYINYTNYSIFDAPNASVTIELDPYMSLFVSSVPYVDLGNNIYRLDLGTVPATSAGAVSFVVELSCEAPLGATHCVNAEITPFNCEEESFAILEVEGECDEDANLVRFNVRNIGQAPTTMARTAIIVEDVIMYMEENEINLGVDEVQSFDYPANGSTWRFEIEQDPTYPYGGIAASFVEGCGGFTPNVATQFALNTKTPNMATDCQENIGSWDPNDKQAFPRGVGEEHIIEANTALEYLIRFQNTGTDTAFTVMIEDQLSEHLKQSSLRPGASSHPYRLEQNEDGLLRFHFENILLVDSTTNEAASHGFVKFYIEQEADLALGTLIENTAHIFFDFNEAVITNTVQHTIGEFVVMVDTEEVFEAGVSLSVSPNPLQTQATIQLNNYNCKDGLLQIFDLNGRLLQEQTFTGDRVALEATNLLPQSMYFFKVFDQQKVLATGKLVKG